jgi:hypothetical protein
VSPFPFPCSGYWIERERRAALHAFPRPSSLPSFVFSIGTDFPRNRLNETLPLSQARGSTGCACRFRFGVLGLWSSLGYLSFGGEEWEGEARAALAQTRVKEGVRRTRAYGLWCPRKYSSQWCRRWVETESALTSICTLRRGPRMVGVAFSI